jgi:hypothetical protein
MSRSELVHLRCVEYGCGPSFMLHRIRSSPYDLCHPDLHMCNQTRRRSPWPSDTYVSDDHATGSCRTISVSSCCSPAYPTKQLPFRSRAAPRRVRWCPSACVHALYHCPQRDDIVIYQIGEMLHPPCKTASLVRAQQIY